MNTRHSARKDTPRRSHKQHKNPRLKFAAALTGLFDELKIAPTEYEELGAEIAQAQLPPRSIPYNGFTVDGWLKAELLPTEPAYNALCSVLKRKTPELADYLDGELHRKLKQARTLEYSENHCFPTELSHALLTAKKAMGRSGEAIDSEAKSHYATPIHGAGELARERAEKLDIPVKESVMESLPRGAAVWNSIMQGDKMFSVPKMATYEINRQLSASGKLSEFDPSPLAIHEQTLRERADTLWEAAEKKHDLGGMIHACRIRLGETMSQFHYRSLSMAGIEGAPHDSTTIRWEQFDRAPIGTKSLTDASLCEPMVAMMKLADTSPNALALSIREPWFTPEKETVLREAFIARIERLNNSGRGHNHPIPSSELSPPDKKKISPLLKVYSGSLKGLLVNGNEIARQGRGGPARGNAFSAD